MTGIELIAAERNRQIGEEGFSAQHDAKKDHQQEELAWAACYYAMPNNANLYVFASPEDFFPDSWHPYWAKRDKKDRLRQLAVAGALIAAEIDRLLACEQ